MLKADVMPLAQKPLSRFWQRVDTAAFVLLCVYLVEMCLGNSGNWLMFGPLSIRMVLFAACCVLTLPAVLRQMKALLCDRYMWVLAAFFVWLGVCAVIGYAVHNKPAFIKADITSVLSLVLVPGFLATVATSKRLHIALDTFFYASLTLALIGVVLHFTLVFASSSAVCEINDYLYKISFGGVNHMPSGDFRIYFRSQIVLQVAWLLGLWKLFHTTDTATKIALWAGEGVFAFAILLSYTRCFWLGVAAELVLAAVVFRKHWRFWLRTCTITLLTVLVFFGASWLAYGKPCVFESAKERLMPFLVSDRSTTVTPATKEGLEGIDAVTGLPLNMRTASLQEHAHWIAANPLFGNGLGKNLDTVRTEGKTEYIYHDIWMKTGLIGLVLFLAVILYYPVGGAVRLLRRRVFFLRPDDPQSLSAIMAIALIGVAVTSSLNPFLTTPMGIAILMLVIATIRLTPTEGEESAVIRKKACVE